MTDLLSVDIVDAISLTGFAAKWNKIGTTNGCFSTTFGCFLFFGGNFEMKDLKRAENFCSRNTFAMFRKDTP